MARKVTVPSISRQSNTYPQSRHLKSSVAAVDWYEIGGMVKWSRKKLVNLKNVHQSAKDQNKPVPFKLAERTVYVFPDGNGSGKGSRMEYVITWGKVEIAFSLRPSEDRRVSNFHLRATGEPCLVVGIKAILEFQNSLIESLGGHLKDSWIKRLDLSLDIPGMPLNDGLLNRCREECFVSSCSQWFLYSGKHGETGFTFKSDNIVTVNLYDKLQQVQGESHTIKRAILQYLWNDKMPQAAVRLEYQIHKQWFVEHSIRSAPEALSRLGDIIAKLTSERPFPLLRMTATPPDKKNGHQQRAKTDLAWKWIIETFRSGFVDGIKPLERLKRDRQTGSPDILVILGCLTKIAAVQEIRLQSRLDVRRFLRKLLASSSVSDEKIRELWSRHAMNQGTFDSARRIRRLTHER